VEFGNAYVGVGFEGECGGCSFGDLNEEGRREEAAAAAGVGIVE
jgi:hypothetical protein